MTPNLNEVWRTKQGNLCLIIEDFITPAEQVAFTAAHGKRKFAMLWCDPMDKAISVCSNMDRLAERVPLCSPAVLLAQFANMLRTDNDPGPHQS